MTSILPAKFSEEAYSSASVDLMMNDSGFKHLLGYRVVHWEAGLIELALEVKDQHHNRSRSVHGGVLAALVDVASALSGLYCPVPGNVRKATTLSLNISFTGRVAYGILRVRGQLRRAGRQIYFASTEIFDADGQLVAFGDAVNRYQRGSELEQGIPLENNDGEP